MTEKDAPEGRRVFRATNPRADRSSENPHHLRMWFDVGEARQQLEIRLTVEDADKLQRYLRKHIRGD